MPVRSDYVTGTITLTNGDANFTGTGTGWAAAGFKEGDTIFDVTGATEYMGVVNTITGPGAGTLTKAWEGPTLTTAYRMRYQPDGSRVPAQAAQLIEILGNGNLVAFAELDGSGGNLVPMFDGAGSMVLISKLSLTAGVDYDVQVDELADRAAYDGQLAGYSVLVSDIGDGRAAVYSKNSATAGDWSDPAFVTGPVGPMVTIEAGTTTTLAAGSPATVDVVPVAGGYEIDFGIPQGIQGIHGIPGPEGAGLEIDASGPFSERADYDTEAAGFVFLATDTGDLYIRETATAGVWSGAIPFQAPPSNIITTDGVGDGTAGPYTLVADPTGGSIVSVTVSGVTQYDYVIVADEITFGLSVPVGVPWQVKTVATLAVGTPNNDSVGADQIDGADAVAIRAKIGAGVGDVIGPAGGSTDNHVVLFDGTTGKLLKGGGILLTQTIAAQAEAQAGVENTKRMTALRTREAILAVAPRFDASQIITQTQKGQVAANIGQAWEQIGSRIVGSANQPSVVYTDLSAYVALRMRGNFRPVNSGVSVSLRVSSDNGATWFTTSIYSVSGFVSSGTAVTADSTTGTGLVFNAVGDIGNVYPIDCVIELSGFNKARRTHVKVEAGWVNSAASLEYTRLVRGRIETPTAMDAIQIFSSLGNFDINDFVLEGLRG